MNYENEDVLSYIWDFHALDYKVYSSGMWRHSVL
jgi:hypothetical protein